MDVRSMELCDLGRATPLDYTIAARRLLWGRVGSCLSLDRGISRLAGC